MTVLKGQSMERGNKRVRLEPASEACVFVIEPAFKTYSSGDQVSSGRCPMPHVTVAAESRSFVVSVYVYRQCSGKDQLALEPRKGMCPGDLATFLEISRGSTLSAEKA